MVVGSLPLFPDIKESLVFPRPAILVHSQISTHEMVVDSPTLFGGLNSHQQRWDLFVLRPESSSFVIELLQLESGAVQAVVSILENGRRRRLSTLDVGFCQVSRGFRIARLSRLEIAGLTGFEISLEGVFGSVKDLSRATLKNEGDQG